MTAPFAGARVPPQIVRLRRQRLGGQLFVLALVCLIGFGMAASVWWR